MNMFEGVAADYLASLFEKMLSKSQDVFWARDKTFTKIAFITDVIESMGGVSAADLIQNPDLWVSCIHPEDRIHFQEMFKTVQDPAHFNKVLYCNYRIIHKVTHEVRYMHEEVFAIIDEVKGHVGFAGILRDVSHEHERLTEVGQATYFFRLFAEKMNAVFWVMDVSCHRQIYVSPGFDKIWKRPRKILYESPDTFMNFVHPDDRHIPSNPARFEMLSKQGMETQYENHYRIILPDGSIRWIKDTSFPIQDKQNNFIGFAGIAEDVTVAIESEASLREAKEKAEVANKAKSEFLAMVSHELRTPLNAILGMSQILSKKDVTDEMKQYLGDITEAGENLLSLVNDILDFARLEAGKLTFAEDIVDIKHVFQRAISSMRYMALVKKLDLILEVSEPLDNMIIGDANRIRQVIINLLSNAIKFTEQGSIVVTLNSIPLDQETIGFNITVKDTGIGIPADKLQDIFEKFNKIDSIYQRKHSGIGLGLAITKELITHMGGSIEVHSRVGEGSQFHFTLSLPKAQMKETVAESKLKAIKDPGSYFMTVLMIEDNIINQNIAKAMLEHFGCRVDVFDNAKSALALNEKLAAYDIIFTDIGLPDFSGYELTAALRAMPALVDKPIVAMTAHVLEEDLRLAKEAGINRVIAKPISYETIQEVLASYLPVRSN